MLKAVAWLGMYSNTEAGGCNARFRDVAGTVHKLKPGHVREGLLRATRAHVFYTDLFKPLLRVMFSGLAMGKSLASFRHAFLSQYLGASQYTQNVLSVNSYSGLGKHKKCNAKPLHSYSGCTSLLFSASAFHVLSCHMTDSFSWRIATVSYVL